VGRRVGNFPTPRPKKKNTRAETVHLSLSGGGARGLAHIGCLRAVERLRLRVTEVSGSSIGAMVAALYAAGYSSREIEALSRTLTRRQLLRYNWPEARALANLFRPRNHRKPSGIWSLEPYYRTLTRLLRRARFRDLKLSCFIQATDLTNLRPIVFSRDLDPWMEVAFAVKASSAFPGVMTPVEWGGLTLADGGTFVNLAAIRIRARRVIVSCLSPLGEDARVPVTSLPKVLQAWMRYRERVALPPDLFAPNVTLITYPPSLTQLKPFKLARPEVGRRIIAEAYRTALAVLSKRTRRA
jgi:predicted acylesterase/phospholipase RssA